MRVSPAIRVGSTALLLLVGCGSAALPGGTGGAGGSVGTGGQAGGAGRGGAGLGGMGGLAGMPLAGNGGAGGSAAGSGGGGGACPTLPAAPGLLRPMRGAYTGSLHAPAAMATLRPTFSWSAVAPTCGALTYQIQADDSCMPGALAACAFPSPELDAKGIAATKYAPAQDLKVATTAPVGAFYAWRVRACDGNAQCGAWSEVRYLHVGRVREDIDGDGYGDLLALSSDGLEVYLGTSQFNPSNSSHTLPYTGAGAPLSFVGDVNGDGFGDFFGTSSYSPSSGFAPTLYLGGHDVTALTTVILTKTAGGPSTMLLTNSAGDLNGDGFADLIVQWAYSITTPQTELRIFFGGATLANTPDLSIPGPYVNDYTLQHSGRIGDVNGDGFEDIALTAFSDGGSNGGVVQIFAGGPQPSKTVAASVTTTAATYQIEPAGDVNGDGFDDAVVVLAGTGYYLYAGAAQLPTAFANSWTAAWAAGAVGGFDLDRDGFADFLIGNGMVAAPALYRGTATGATVVSGALANLTASVIVGFSDHDGDGRPDFIGTSGQASGGASVEWAGSDGTTNPRAVLLRLLDTSAQFSGLIAR
jgi:FG-GAP-like repeat